VEKRVPEGQPEVPEAQDEAHEVPDRVPEVREEVREDQHEVRADPLVPEAQLVEEAASEDGGGTTAQHQRRGDRLLPEEPEPRALQTKPKRTMLQAKTSHENLPVASPSTRPKARKHATAVVSKSEGSHQCGSRQPANSLPAKKT